MAYTYATFVSALSTEVNISSTETNFVIILPTIIDQAEQRIYRDLDLLSTIVSDTSATTSANQRSFTLPQDQGRFVTVQSINIFNSSNERVPLTKVSREAIDLLWPSETAASATTIPSKYAPLTDQQVLFGPPPGAAFTVEVIGTIRPASLSASNTTTFLSQYLPDLFLAASMVAASGYMRNFGSQADDPKMALSWESDYQMRLASASAEEMRKKFQAFGSTGA